jgi:hypothetical protein
MCLLMLDKVPKCGVGGLNDHLLVVGPPNMYPPWGFILHIIKTGPNFFIAIFRVPPPPHKIFARRPIRPGVGVTVQNLKICHPKKMHDSIVDEPSPLLLS